MNQDYRAPHIRITILRALDEQSDCRLNDSILYGIVNDFGIGGVSRDQIRTEIGWLKDQGLVSVRNIEEMKIATLTEAGSDVANARRIVDGVKRPSPRRA